MIIKSLALNNFRNYNNLSVVFGEGINILYGDNAQGKTNILESIYIGSTTKSHKGSKDKEVIKLDKEEAHIRILLEKQEEDRKIDMHLRKNQAKGIAIDNIPIRKYSELIGLVNIVFFSPEDLSIIKNGPSERRKFIDRELCQLDKIYLSNLSNYQKIINQRNNLLKQIGFNKELMDTLSIWDTQLLEYGTKIILGRQEFIKQINKLVNKIHKKLCGGKEELIVQYEPNTNIENFESKLKQSLDKDIVFKTTSVGPHRDDIIFLVENIDIRKFGSQGQQRTAALSLKLAEIELIKILIKDNPILLLDDVLSELDRNRQNYLLDSIDGIQTIITCTGLKEFVDSRLKINNIYKVIKGTIQSEGGYI